MRARTPDNLQQLEPTGTTSPIIPDVLIDAGRRGVADIAAVVEVRDKDEDAGADVAVLMPDNTRTHGFSIRPTLDYQARLVSPHSDSSIRK